MMNDTEQVSLQTNQENKPQDYLETVQINSVETEPKTGSNVANELFGAPESYSYEEINMPDGMELDTELTEKFNVIAKKYNMSQAGANELIALAVELTTKTGNGLQDAINSYRSQQLEEYKKALNDDKEIGGAKLEQTLKIANTAYKHFVPQETDEVLRNAGLTINPSIIKMFHSIGQQMKNDSIFQSRTPIVSELSPAEILYGKTTFSE